MMTFALYLRGILYAVSTVLFAAIHVIGYIASFDAELLAKAEGDFAYSDYVYETVGVGNVCERAAILGCMNSGELVVTKTAGDGITVAVAKRRI